MSQDREPPSNPGRLASQEGVTMFLFPCHVPKATCTLPHPHVKKPEKGEVRIPSTRKSRAQTVLRVAGSKQQTLSHSQRVAASQGTHTSLGLELS